MTQHDGYAADACTTAEETYHAYRRAMADGRVDPDEDRGLRRLTAGLVTHQAEILVSLRLIARVTKCASASERRRELRKEWEETNVARLFGDDDGPDDGSGALEAA